MNNFFPELPLEEWEDSKITLHLWLQIVGKVKLGLNTSLNHWWHITLFIVPNGISTGVIPYKNGSFAIRFDFKKHKLNVNSSWAEDKEFDLVDGLTIKAFYERLFSILEELEIDVEIKGVPYDHPCTEPFAECETHKSYDKKYVERFSQIMIQIDAIFKEFSGKFYGKVSPVQLFWHHMDLAVTRFSGAIGPEPHPDATQADKEAYSHEVISAGFWAGDENVREAAFYAYTFPSPRDLEKETLKPEGAFWDMSSGSPMAMLMYNEIRQMEDPKKAVLDFLQSSYESGAKLSLWSEELNR